MMRVRGEERGGGKPCLREQGPPIRTETREGTLDLLSWQGVEHGVSSRHESRIRVVLNVSIALEYVRAGVI